MKTDSVAVKVDQVGMMSHFMGAALVAALLRVLPMRSLMAYRSQTETA